METAALPRPRLNLVLDWTLVFSFALMLLWGLFTAINATGQHSFVLAGAIWLATGFAAWVAADLASGFIHYLADNFGGPDTPLLGRRVILPFREHHTDPTGILEHDFAERSANNSIIGLLFITWVPFTPLDRTLSLVGAAFCLQMGLWVALTNEVHAFAHRSQTPPWVAHLQSLGIILPPDHHQAHHDRPDEDGTNYCITSGICERVWQGLHQPKLR